MPFEETHAFADPMSLQPIRELNIKIAGTPLEPIIREFDNELASRGLRIKPTYYLSDEWGVPVGSGAIAIPFYLARPDLLRRHAEMVGYVEGAKSQELRGYLRHELGHVVSYAYELYEREDWVKLFGSMTQPYVEEYRPEPFSRKFVRHLPGWYAQKHPDEDWAETFAVWLTPGLDWRRDYADWPEALAKLNYCDRIMKELVSRDPPHIEAQLDEPVEMMAYSLKDFYRNSSAAVEMPLGLDGSLRAIFENLGEADHSGVATVPASKLISKVEGELMAVVYRWTGHFPERTRALLRYLAERAEALQQIYPQNLELEASVALTTFVTALAMNYVLRGSYVP